MNLITTVAHTTSTMALVSGASIITSLSLFHITIAFFFLTSPDLLADHTLVFIIGEAMGLPYSRSFENKSPSLAFLAAVLLLLGVSDLVSLLQPERVIELHWGAQAPVRLLIFFFLSFYSYSLSESSPMFVSNPYIASAWGEGLKNRVFFTWSFIEMITWFWVYITLREERKGPLSRVRETQASGEK